MGKELSDALKAAENRKQRTSGISKPQAAVRTSNLLSEGEAKYQRESERHRGAIALLNQTNERLVSSNAAVFWK